MRISDWSSDVCSSDLETPGNLSLDEIQGHRRRPPPDCIRATPMRGTADNTQTGDRPAAINSAFHARAHWLRPPLDPKRVASGKGVSVRVDTGGRRHITQKHHTQNTEDNNKHIN